MKRSNTANWFHLGFLSLAVLSFSAIDVHAKDIPPIQEQKVKFPDGNMYCPAGYQTTSRGACVAKEFPEGPAYACTDGMWTGLAKSGRCICSALYRVDASKHVCVARTPSPRPPHK